MNAEIIYEKKYPRIDVLEELRKAKIEFPDDPNEEKLSFNEYMEKIHANTTYILMHGRLKASEKFIREAINVSKFYEIDAIIKRHFDHISADLSFDCGAMRYISKLFGMADEIAFFTNTKERNLTVSLSFYTHTVVRNGRIVAP